LDALIPQLAQAIYSWLTYVEYTSNSHILAESSVRYPLVEFVERRYGKIVDLEIKHPVLAGRRIDFAICDGNDGEEEKEKVAYIELKYARSWTRTSEEAQLIFNDLMRLALLSDEADCFFIMCGRSDDFIQNFKRIIKLSDKTIPTRTNDTEEKRIAMGVYSEFFGFTKGSEMNIDLPSQQGFVAKFKSDYNNVEISFNSFRTSLVEILPKEEDNNSPQTVAIWRVEKTDSLTPNG